MLKREIIIIWKVLRNSILFIGLIAITYVICYFFYRDSKIEIELDSCIDGDTAWFVVDGKREKVRFLGIDTPESTNYIEEYGVEASRYTCNKLENAKDIYIEYDVNSERYDKYDRVLGYVFVDDKNLSQLLLLEGLAEVEYIYGDYKYIDELCDSQYIAYNNKLGIWNKYKYEDNYCYGRE